MSLAPAQTIDGTLHAVRAARVVLCVRLSDPALALRAAAAAVAGGLRGVEIAMTMPGAAGVMRELIDAFPDVVVGAGSVLSVAQAEEAADAGARFALSPVCDAGVVNACHARGLLAVPGAATPTECWRAFYGAGARCVKVFPIDVCGGVGFVNAMRGPLPDVLLLPTSGVDLGNLKQYMAAENVAAVGASRQILLKEALDNRDWDTITRRARVWADVVAEFAPRETDLAPRETDLASRKTDLVT